MITVLSDPSANHVYFQVFVVRWASQLHGRSNTEILADEVVLSFLPPVLLLARLGAVKHRFTRCAEGELGIFRLFFLTGEALE